MVESSDSIRLRRPWIAAVLSLIIPGLGHLYNGDYVKAVMMFALFLCSWIAALFVVLNLNLAPINVVVGLGLFLVALISIAVHAYRQARRTQNHFLRHRYDRWYVYTGIIIVFGFVVQPTIAARLKVAWVEAFQVPNNSMAPTLQAGDYLLVRKAIPAELGGRLVVFRAPLDGSPLYMKRVAARAGDTVQMDSKALKVNGRLVKESYVQYVDLENDTYSPSMYWQRSALLPGRDTAEYKPTRDNWGPLVVPPQHVFVLGDNRDDSEDSRYWGFVSRSEIVGYPKRLYFAYRAGIRWRRIGLDVSHW